MPVTSMGHNWVLSETGNLQDIAMKGAGAGADNDYLPQGDDRILAHTKLVGGGESTTIHLFNRWFTRQRLNLFLLFPRPLDGNERQIHYRISPVARERIIRLSRLLFGLLHKADRSNLSKNYHAFHTVIISGSLSNPSRVPVLLKSYRCNVYNPRPPVENDRRST